MPKTLRIEELLKNGSTEWNKLRKAGTVSVDHTGATFENLFSANTDLSGLVLVGSEWDRCDLLEGQLPGHGPLERLLPRRAPARLRLPGRQPRRRDVRAAEAAPLRLLGGAGPGGAGAGRRGHGPGPRAWTVRRRPRPRRRRCTASTSFTREQRQASVAALAGIGRWTSRLRSSRRIRRAPCSTGAEAARRHPRRGCWTRRGYVRRCPPGFRRVPGSSRSSARR